MTSDLLPPPAGSWALPLLVVAPLLLAACLPRAAGARGEVLAASASLGAAIAALALGLTDPLPGSCLVFAAGVVLVTTAFSVRHLDGDPAAPGYRRAFLLTAAGAVAVLAAADLLLVAAGWLLTGGGLLRLVGHHAGLAATDQAVRALRRAGRVGDLALLVAVACWAVPAGSTAVPDVARQVAADPSSPASVVGALALLVAVVARCALMPFHRWLPASVVAPAPVSALLHAGIVNGPVLVLVTTSEAWTALGWFGPALVVVGLGTSVLTFPRLLVRPDVKGRLAWSTVAQIGFMVALVGIGAHTAAALHLMLHGLYKANAFLRAAEHLSRAREDRLPAGSPQAGLAGAVAGALVGLVAVVADRGWEQPLLSAVVVVAAAGAGQGLMSVQARWVTRLAAAVLATAVLAGIHALPRIAADLWQEPPAPAGPSAWAAAVAVGLLAVAGVWALTRRPVAVWALLHRSADPLVGSSQAVLARLRRRSRAVPSVPVPSVVAVPSDAGPAPAGQLAGASADDDRAAVRAAVAAAAEALPPAWSWQAFVAANPLWGARDLDLDAAVELDRARKAQAARAAAADPGVDHVVAGWVAAWTCTTPVPWATPGRERSLWQWLRTVAVHDPLLRAAGPVPVLPERALDHLAAAWQGERDRQGRAETELLRLPGWSALLARRSTTAAQVDVDVLVDLLAVREVARALAGPVLRSLPNLGAADTDTDAGAPGGLSVAELERQEAPLRDRLLPALAGRARTAFVSAFAEPASSGRTAPRAAEADLVFCIDGRSEVLRRHLERHGPYRTIGFAGFFGLPLRRRTASGGSSDRLPALLAPGITVTGPARTAGVADLLRAGLQRALDLPGGGFAAVEVAGVTGFVGLLTATRAWPQALRRTGSRPPSVPAARLVEADRAEAVQAAVALVRATGLARDTAPLVVLVGHGSTSANNAAEAAFDCGACGGHRGELNARLAAELLNAADTRAALAAAGLALPAGTVVLAAEHDTATDAVHLLDPDPAVMAGPIALDALARLQVALVAAGAATAQERCADLPLVRGRSARSARAAAREVRRRSLDPSEVRHEWGLAGNAFFVAGPRSLTRGLDLAGRAFLHEYDPATDPGDTGLETILTAPLVVAHWINAQYLFSTHDPAAHGAGSKTAHNPVGGVGVLNGPAGDLCLGLTEQSVRHGARPFREQTRLLAVVVAEPSRIDAVLHRHPDVLALVTGRWLRLAALHPQTGLVSLRDRTGWQPYEPQTSSPTREHGGSHDLDIRDPHRQAAAAAEPLGDRAAAAHGRTDLAGAGRP